MGVCPVGSEDLLQPRGLSSKANIFSRMSIPLLCPKLVRIEGAANVLTGPTCDLTCQPRLSSRVSTPDSPVPPWVNVPMLEDHRLSCLRVHFHKTQV